ncbi:MAG: hypothetical protein WB698_04295 [Solirubrobacteraceae bacterium]
MQDQGTEPRCLRAERLTVMALETGIIAALTVEGSDPIWIREELAREFPAAGIRFEQALESLQRAQVLHTCGRLVKLSRAARRVAELLPIPDTTGR